MTWMWPGAWPLMTLHSKTATSEASSEARRPSVQVPRRVEQVLREVKRKVGQLRRWKRQLAVTLAVDVVHSVLDGALKDGERHHLLMPVSLVRFQPLSRPLDQRDRLHRAKGRHPSQPRLDAEAWRALPDRRAVGGAIGRAAATATAVAEPAVARRRPQAARALQPPACLGQHMLGLGSLEDSDERRLTEEVARYLRGTVRAAGVAAERA